MFIFWIYYVSLAEYSCEEGGQKGTGDGRNEGVEIQKDFKVWFAGRAKRS